MKTVFVLALAMMASAAAAAQGDALSCASWNANHAYGKRTMWAFSLEMWVNGYVAASMEQWMVDGTHHIPDRHVGSDAVNAAVSLYCQQIPDGNLFVAASNAAETLYPKKRR